MRHTHTEPKKHTHTYIHTHKKKSGSNSGLYLTWVLPNLQKSSDLRNSHMSAAFYQHENNHANIKVKFPIDKELSRVTNPAKKK